MATKLVIGQRIQVRLLPLTLEEGTKRKFYSSRIEEEDSEAFYIAEPLDGTTPFYIPLGREIEVIFNDEKGTYLFKSTVLERVDQNIRFLKISKPTLIEKTNRRDYFRLQVFIPFTFKILPEEKFRYGFPHKSPTVKGSILGSRIDEDGDKLDGIIKDVSGGGALLAISDKIEVNIGDHLELWLPISYEESPLYLWADIVRVSHNPDSTRWNKEIGVFFSKVDERDRDKIVSQILALQRELLKKGALQSDK